MAACSKSVAIAFILGTLSCCGFLREAVGQTRPVSLSLFAPENPKTFHLDDKCVLLTKALCDGLPQDQATTSTATQDSGQPGKFHRGFNRLLRDQEGLWVAPFKPSSLKWDALVLLGTGALIATDRQTSINPSQHTIDVSSNISNAAIYGTATTAGSIWIAGLVSDNPHQKETGLLTLEALTDAMPIYTVLQVIAGRERPGDGAGHGRFWQKHSVDGSFPAGHAMFAWTMATVIAHEYPRWWVKVLLYGSASTVAVTRFTARDHFASDSAVAVVLGYLIGRHVFHAHCNPEFSEDCHASH